MPDKELYGFLYPKKDREGNQPHLTGTIQIEGKVWELAGWSKRSKAGEKYISLKAQEQGGHADENDDDLPF